MKNIILTCLLALTIAACSQDENQDQQSNIIPVKYEEVKSEKYSVPVHSTGILTTTTETKLSFKVPGIIDEIFVNAGTSVSRGKLLAKLNLSEIESHLTQAKEGLEKAERDYRRIKNLYDDDVVTKEQLQNMNTALEVAKSILKAAQFNYDHSSIYAPLDGKILHRLAEEKELVGAGTPVFLFGSNGGGWIVKVGVSDREVIKLNPGDNAEVNLDAYPGKIIKGKITEIAGTADPMTGIFPVEVTLDKTKLILISGFVCKVDLFPGDNEELKSVPINSLVEADGNKAFVFAANPVKTEAVKIHVEIAYISQEKAFVRSGLNEVNYVITDGASYLVNGSKIKLIESK